MIKTWKIDPREQIADVCHRLYERGYLVATSGNVSAKTTNGFFITPAMTRKDSVDGAMVVECDDKGNSLDESKTPSSEIAMHAAIYEARGDVGAAVHAHPPYCLAGSLIEIPMNQMPLPELAAFIGPVPTVPYATPGTNEMADVLTPFLADHDAFLLSRHGVLVLGENLEDAFNRLEHLEHLARIAYLVKKDG